MLDILAQFDALGLGTLAGSLLFLAGLIWVLVDNRSFEEVSRRHQDAVAPKARPAITATVTMPADAMAVEAPVDAPKGPERDDPAGPGRGAPTRPERGAPGRPVRTRRAA